MGAFDGIITPEFKQLYKDAITALLEDTALTVPCTFVYGDTKFTQCPNCEFDAIGNKSANIYKGGGPIAFVQGNICPVCNGKGRKPTESTETVYLMVLWNYKDWINWDYRTQAPDGMIQTICSISLLPKIKQAKKIIVDGQLVGLARHEFIRHQEPNPLGFNDNFISTMWKKV